MGLLARVTVARGTKSERVALVLESPDGRLRVRRRGARAYGDPDPELEKLVGHLVRLTGEVVRDVLLVDVVAASDPPS